MATLPAANYFNNASRTEGEFKQAQEDFLASVKQVPGAGTADLAITIASGSITPAGSGGVLVIDTEAAAATDDLTNIVTTNYPDGSMLLIRNSNSARSVVAKHLAGGAGQFNLDRSVDYTLDDTKKWLLLQRRSADWYEVFRGPQRIVPTESPIINGSMEVWQRGTSFAAIANAAYHADRWSVRYVTAGVATITRSTNVPTVAQAGLLFNYSLEVDVTTIDSSIAAGDFFAVTQRIEGYNWRPFAQRQFTLSFWVMSTKTGTHCVAFRNNAAGTPDRSYIGTYTINTTNTWEYKTVTVTASPSAGTWDYTTGSGLEVSFILAAGSTFQTTAGAWQTGNFYGTSAQVNCLDSTSNFFRLTGVRMELGNAASPLEFMPFGRELRRCQRYYQKSFNYATAPAQNAGLAGMLSIPSTVGASTIFPPYMTPFVVTMRTAPTVMTYNPSAANAQVRAIGPAQDCSAVNTSNLSDGSLSISATSSAGTVVGHQLGIHWSADAEL